MKNKHQATFFVIVLILVTSCINKEQKSFLIEGASQNQNEHPTVNEVDNNAPQFSLVKREYFGTIAKATINDNNVNIRLLPNISSKKIASVNQGDIVEIRGYSSKKEVINNYEGYWLKVSVKDKNNGYYGDTFGHFGWIFSQFVDVDPNVNVSTFNVLKVNPKTDQRIMTLVLEIDRNGLKIETVVVPHKMANQSFYTFVWSDDISDFVYSDPVGTFKWDPETNEIQNLTNMGYDCESAWCLVTDDFKYLLQDYGTAPGPRGLGVFEIETNKQIFSGTYYRNLDYDGKGITIVKVHNLWNVDKKYIDEQSIKYAEMFRKETPMTEDDKEWEKHGGGVDVIVKYRFNLMTKESEYIGCNYIHAQ